MQLFGCCTSKILSISDLSSKWLASSDERPPPLRPLVHEIDGSRDHPSYVTPPPSLPSLTQVVVSVSQISTHSACICCSRLCCIRMPSWSS